jgi:mannosyltransferase OCH1-like enzyme
MVYIDYIAPRNEYHIYNKYNLINESNDDFHYVIYYIDDYKCKIIVRRLDDNNGWGVNLKVLIYEHENKSELISIGSSNKNCKIMNVYTKIRLEKDKYNRQIIPKIIFQTIGNKNIENIQLHNSILSYIELNPDYEYKLFDDNEMRIFIKNNFDERILIAFDMLIAGAFKADLFRYCYLYIKGGCYFDCKSILRTPLKNIISTHDYLILCKDIGSGYYNAVMLSIKNNDLLLKTIDKCVDNIYNFNRKYDMNQPKFNQTDKILSLTGPVLLARTISNDINKNNVLKFIHKHNNNKIHDYQRLFVEYNDNVIVTKNYKGHNPNGVHYSQLWYNREILYLHTYTYDNYKFYQFNYNVKDIFKFKIINKSTFEIQRLDSNNGWGNILKIKIINELNNTELKVTVGNSEHNNKIINIDNDFFTNI